MTAYTGTIKKIGAERKIGGWSPVTGVHNFRSLAADWHQYRIYAAELRPEYAADALATADTITWIFGHLQGAETLVGAYLIFPRDIVGDAADYHTITIEVGGTAVCSRTTVYGAEAGVAWEIVRSNTDDRAGTQGEALEVIFTLTVGAASEVVQAGTIVVAVTKVTEA